MVNAQRTCRTRSILLHPADTVYPQSEMALGFGKKSRTVDNTTTAIDPTAHGTPQVAIGNEGVFGYDSEAQGEKRKMSRVGGPNVIMETDSQLSVGKQLELEASNSIKYRTCSWQKVI